MKAKGRVKMIQQEREARKINLPFCHLKQREKSRSPDDQFGTRAILSYTLERIDKGLKRSFSLSLSLSILVTHAIFDSLVVTQEKRKGGGRNFSIRALFSPVGQRAPERRAEEFDERSEPHEKAALEGVHPHLLEIDAHQREQGAERRVEEEIERLHREQLLVHGAEQILDHVAFPTYLVRRLLRLGIKVWVDLAVGMGVDHGPRAWNLW